MSDALLELIDVHKTFAAKSGLVEAVDGASYTLAKGAFVSIVGPSGCGKSTLLRLLAGIEHPTSGRIMAGDEEVTGPRREVGFMFQAPALLPWRSVVDNVLFPVDVFRWRRREYAGRAEALLKMVGIWDFRDSYPRELSGGMQQRAAMCRALIHEPALLLLDEPFGALDNITREQLNDELLEVWDRTGSTVVLVTHNVEEAVYLSDEVIVMSPRPGRIVEVLDVDLPRPRTYKTRTHDAFERAALQARSLLGLAGR